MASYTIPFVDKEIDTSEPGESAQNSVLAVASFATLFAVVGVATYGYNRIKSLAGVEGDQDIPGV